MPQYGHVWPATVVAALMGAVVIGLIDGVASTGDLPAALAAAGFVSFLAVPAGILLSIVARGLWWAWNPARLVAVHTENTGGAPRLAAWLVYLLAAGWGLAVATFNILAALLRATQAKHVIALGAALLVTAVAAGLVLVSRPAVDLLSHMARRLDRAVHRRIGKSPFTSVALGAGALVLVAALCTSAWFVSIRPRIGHLDIDPLYYLALFCFILAAVHWWWPRLRWRPGRAVMAGIALAGAALVFAGALYARYVRPYSMITVWADTELAGGAMDLLYDVQELRRKVRVRSFRPAERADRAPGRHPDVVLITIDTLRADRMALYGGSDVMPNLGALGKEGAVFEWAFAPGNVTRRSVPAIATGLHPTRVSGRVAGWALRLDPRHVIVTERFRAAGYDTAGFFCCNSHFGPEHRLGLIRGMDHLVLKKDGAALADMARAWLEEHEATRPDKPVFVWFHFIEPHLWEQDYPKKTHPGDNRQRYDMSLRATDRALQTVLSAFWTDARKDRTIIAVTSDHGESLGDHGSSHHSSTLYNSEIRVPLIIAGPGVKARRIARPTGVVSVAPTLLDLAGFVPPGQPQMDGESLGPLVRDEMTGDPGVGEAYAVMMRDRSVRHTVHALVRGRYKYIEREGSPVRELYDILADPQERSNLIKVEDKAALVKDMQARLAELRQASRVLPF